MKRVLLFALCSLMPVLAQPRHTGSFRQNFQPRPKSALVDPNDRVLPDIIAGGGWETILTFVNMSSSPIRFTLDFYDDNGDLIDMPLANPDNSISRYASIDFALDSNTSSEVVIANVDKDFTSAWSYLSQVSGAPAIAGIAVVRAKDAKGNVISETTEILSNTQDYDFFAPYDNLEGVATTLILVNPGNTQTANVRISAQDANGREIVRDRIQLAPGARAIITLPETYPQLDETSGKLRVTGDTNALSAICYRTAPSDSMAYSPIFNWSGMFQ